MVEKVVFYELCALPGERLALAGYRPGIDFEQGYGSLFIEYHPPNPSGIWSRRFIPEWITSLATFKASTHSNASFTALTFQGSVLIFNEGSEIERLPVKNESAAAIRQIGDRLFACDLEGHTLTRKDGRWEIMPIGIYDNASVFEKFIIDINGPSEDEVYFVGRSGLGFWNGRFARPLNAPKDLTRIYVEDPFKIWVCGWDGVLLCGNHKDGFKRIWFGKKVSFTSITMFKDVIYLGGSQGFWSYDGKSFATVVTALDPEPSVIRQVAATPEALWGIGDSDLVRYDGKSWERLKYPSRWEDDLEDR